MKSAIILHPKNICKEELIHLLTCDGEEEKELFDYTRQLRNHTIGNNVYMRGLIEISNICIKDCLYCGIRKSNLHTKRYSLSDDEILQAARYAWENHYGSVVLQGGERNDAAFILRIEKLLKQIKNSVTINSELHSHWENKQKIHTKSGSMQVPIVTY